MIKLNGKTIRFIIVGVLGALVYFIASYLFLTYTELPAYLASLLAYACSFGFAYLGQKLWAFRSIAPHSVTLFRYAVLQACCATFAATFTQLFVSYSEWSPLLLSGVATIFTSGISYIVSSCWVFADSAEQETTSIVPVNSGDKSMSYGLLGYWRQILLISAWIVACALYINLYYYMPWGINLIAGHDDALFVNLANSIVAGNWLGSFSQYTLMKGPGYSVFLALTHTLGLPLYILTAVFHCIAVSFFAWALYRISQSQGLSILLFVLLLLLPLVISSGRIIRDQIYPDQFLLGLAALIFSLFVADTFLKRSSSAILAGMVFAWFWLTREEGVWVLPSVALLSLFALWLFWQKKCLRQGLISTVLIMILSFSSIHIAFRFINLQAYGRFVGLDIKEKNFKAALSALQSVRVGESISHVPVSQAAMQEIYTVSPSFSELNQWFEEDGLVWRYNGCKVYPWTCGEIAGGWFIWALREAAASQGYYHTPIKAADFFAKVAREVNQACADKRLNCSKNLIAFMPEITPHGIDMVPESLSQMFNVLSLRKFSSNNVHTHTAIEGEYSGQQAVLQFLHSRDRYQFDKVRKAKGAQIFLKYAVDNTNTNKLDIEILNMQGEAFSYNLSQLSYQESVDNFHPYMIETSCPKKCDLVISLDGQEMFKALIPDVDKSIKQPQALVLAGVHIFFEKVVRGRRLLTAVVGNAEKNTYKVRLVLLETLQFMLPTLLFLGLMAFFVLLVVAIRQRHFSIMLVLSAAMWGAILARLTILFLVDITSFPAINKLYFMPVYSLLIIASVISLYLLISLPYNYFQRRLV